MPLRFKLRLTGNLEHCCFTARSKQVALRFYKPPNKHQSNASAPSCAAIARLLRVRDTEQLICSHPRHISASPASISRTRPFCDLCSQQRGELSILLWGMSKPTADLLGSFNDLVTESLRDGQHFQSLVSNGVVFFFFFALDSLIATSATRQQLSQLKATRNKSLESPNSRIHWLDWISITIQSTEWLLWSYKQQDT